MYRLSVMCSWCHAMAPVTAGPGRTACPACGHDAGVPRLFCDCERCRPLGRIVPPIVDLRDPPDEGETD